MAEIKPFRGIIYNQEKIKDLAKVTAPPYKGREIDFIKDETEAVELIRAGKYQIAFFLKSLSLKEVRETSFAGKILPPKSTYFYPKPLSGMVMRDLEDGIYSP